MEALITSHVKVFLGNKYNCYVHTARNAKVTSARYVYEKTAKSYFDHLLRAMSAHNALFEK